VAFDKAAGLRLRGGLMTWVDLVLLAVLAVSALLAFVRGLVREVLGLAAWVGAIFAGVWALPRVRPQFEQWLGVSPWAVPVAFAAVFIISLIVLLLVSRWVSALVRASAISGLDRTLGLIFGLVRGAALIVIAYILGGLVQHVDQWPKPVLDARSIYFVYRGASWAVDHLPTTTLFQPPPVYPPPSGKEATADALLHANPLGRAVGR
jgi:membrane protein required for colicin V production